MEKSAFCMQPALRLHRLSFLLEKVADQALMQQTELSFSQCMILLSLRDSPGCSQHSIAKCRDLTQAAVSRQIEGLQARGLVLREENSNNRREHVLTLTAKGRKQLEKGMDIITGKFENAFAAVTHQEAAELQTIIDKLLDNMRGTTKSIDHC